VLEGKGIDYEHDHEHDHEEEMSMEPALDGSGKVYIPNDANNQSHAPLQRFRTLRFGRDLFAKGETRKSRTANPGCPGEQSPVASEYLAARLNTPQGGAI
jgi:hypothetical protein